MTTASIRAIPVGTADNRMTGQREEPLSTNGMTLRQALWVALRTLRRAGDRHGMRIVINAIRLEIARNELQSLNRQVTGSNETTYTPLQEEGKFHE